jgi:predicted dinucleotide-binding enzyme
MTRRIIIWGLGKVGRALYEGLRHTSNGVDVVVGREESNQKTADFISHFVGGNSGSLTDHVVQDIDNQFNLTFLFDQISILNISLRIWKIA